MDDNRPPSALWPPPAGFVPVPSQIEGIEIYAPAPEKEAEETRTFKCRQCGGTISYSATQRQLTCPYCGSEQQIDAEVVGRKAKESEFTLETMAEARRGWGEARRELVCESCGAAVTVAPDMLTDTCAFCGSNRVIARDATGDVARELGARVVLHDWQDDFAAARNAAIGEVEDGYLLILDADELLVAGAGEVIRASLQEDDFDIGLLPLHHADTPHAPPEQVLAGARRLGDPVLLPRLLRRTPELRFEGRVHESLRPCLDRLAGRSIDEHEVAVGDRLLVLQLDGGRAVVVAGVVDRDLVLLRCEPADGPARVQPHGDRYVVPGPLALGRHGRGDAIRVGDLVGRR